MKTSAENTTERPPERPPNDPPNDPWFMSCQAQDPGPSLTTTWSSELPAPPHPFFISKIKKTASSSKQQQQQAAGKQQASSRQAAASKQQPAFAPLKEWTHISFKNQRDTKNWTFSRRAALKQWNRSITKSCDDAKLELFPGARPPDTTLRNWYDLNRALVWSSKNSKEIHGFDPQKPLKRFNKSLQIS